MVLSIEYSLNKLVAAGVTEGVGSGGDIVGEHKRFVMMGSSVC